MTEEVQNLAEVVESAPAPEVTATPEQEPIAPEVVETQPEEKKFTQAEIDAMISKRLAREQRKWEREQRQPVQPEITPPAPEQFETPQQYSEFIRQEAAKLVQQQEAQRQQSEILEVYHDLEEKAREKYDDFEQVAYNPKLPITNVMAESIQASEVGPDVAYYLGTNPKEADRISRLSPILQAKEIGKIEAKLSDAPIQKRTTSAPTPVSPIAARSANNPSFDTTDPRSTKSMSTSEWIEAERARQMKKWEAQRTR